MAEFEAKAAGQKGSEAWFAPRREPFWPTTQASGFAAGRNRAGYLDRLLERMNVNSCAAGYYESKPTFTANSPKVDITTAWSSAARIRLSAGPNLGRIHNHTASVFLCSAIFG